MGNGINRLKPGQPVRRRFLGIGRSISGKGFLTGIQEQPGNYLLAKRRFPLSFP